VIVGNVVVCKKLTFDKLVQSVNALDAIVVTELGIVMEVRPEQLENDCCVILVSKFESVTEVRAVEPWNVYDPVLVTESGNVNEVRVYQ